MIFLVSISLRDSDGIKLDTWDSLGVIKQCWLILFFCENFLKLSAQQFG